MSNDTLNVFLKIVKIKINIKEETNQLSSNEEKIENLKSLLNNLEEYINEKNIIEPFDTVQNSLNS